MPLTLKLPEKLQLHGLYVYYVVHICDFGMLSVKGFSKPLSLDLLYYEICANYRQVY